MKKTKQKFAILLIGAITLINLNYSRADGIDKQCRDIELEKACTEALKSADDLILEQVHKSKYLESQLNTVQSQNETLQKILLDANTPAWYAKKETIFVLGLMSGLFLAKEYSK